MKVKCFACALVAGMALSAVAMAEPGVHQAGGNQVGLSAQAVQTLSAKNAVVKHGKYYVSTGRIEMSGESPAVRGPGAPVSIWEASDFWGFWNGLTAAGVGSATTELFDWGRLCGDPLVDSHNIQQVTFAYATGSTATGGLTLWIYSGFDGACLPHGPQNATAGHCCVATPVAGFDFVDLPGDTTPGNGFVDVYVFDALLTPDPLDPLSPDLTFTVPAGEFAYGYSNWTGWDDVTGGLLVNENLITAPGTDDDMDFNTSSPQTGCLGWGGFGGYSQNFLQLWGLTECAPVDIGACCLTPTGDGCVVMNEADCLAAGGTFSSVGQACTLAFCVPAPANDDCLNAVVLPSALPQTVDYDNEGATQSDADPTCGPLGRDVWFKWVSPCTGTVNISSCINNTSDDLFAVYEGSNCGNLSVEVACDDDGCTIPAGPSVKTFSVTQGTSYLIRMGTYNASAGGPTQQFVFTTVSCTGGPMFCDADWCHDGTVGVPDIFCFLSDWFALVPAARSYGGTPGVPAIFAFLSIWFATGQGPCTP